MKRILIGLIAIVEDGQLLCLENARLVLDQ